MTLLEENIAKLKAEGKYHPEDVFKEAPTERASVRPTLGTEEGEIARMAKSPDASLPSELQKLWEKLRLHSSDNPITKSELASYMWPGKPNRDPGEGSDSPARNIRTMLGKLRTEHGKLVGGGQDGYFSIQTEKDLRIENGMLGQKIVGMQDRIKFNNENFEALKGNIKPPEPVQEQF